VARFALSYDFVPVQSKNPVTPVHWCFPNALLSL